MAEYFDIINEAGEIVGRETRERCHSGTFLLHRVVHVIIRNSKGELYLQKRARTKDIQPGKWDTSVGGHVDAGETVEQALHRELREELGISEARPLFLYKYIFQSEVEREEVHTFGLTHDGPVTVQESEIEEGRFFGGAEIETRLGNGFFTPNFELEYSYYQRTGEGGGASSS